MIKMGEICCGVVRESEQAATKLAVTAACEPNSSLEVRRHRTEIRRFKLVASGAPPSDHTEEERQDEDGAQKRRNLAAKMSTALFSRDCEDAKCYRLEAAKNGRSGPETTEEIRPLFKLSDSEAYPKYGVVSVCGRRRDMEDAVAVHPSFLRSHKGFHYFGVYDGHGCSHVAMRCRDRLHELVREELSGMEGGRGGGWEVAMEGSFRRMDKEVVALADGGVAAAAANCRCELQTPDCDAVGSTALVGVVTPENIVVANCGDSRAVLCRNGKPIPLSSDHKPDRPDELDRIEAAGGRVIYWDGPRVLGVLAMSRAIGDNYLKPYVSCDPEVTVTGRTPNDECLIIASDGLWDVVSNEMACRVAHMCLNKKARAAQPLLPVAAEEEEEEMVGTTGVAEVSDKACKDASMLLTKLALARNSTDNISCVVVDLRRDT